LAPLRRRSALELTAVGHFGPILDGALLTEQTQAVFAAGRQARLPLLVGNNADEGSFYAPPQAAAELKDRAATYPPGHAFHAVYPTGDAEQVRESARRWVGDTRFTWPVWHWARTHAETSGAPVWLYTFAQEPSLPSDLDLAPPRDGGAGYGVFHTTEVPFVWNSLDVLDWPWRAEDRRVATAMHAAWVEFIATGRVSWPVLDPAAPATVRFAGPAGSEFGPDPDAASRRLHDRLNA
jgi:para-nitrobenzyl esterase